MLGTSEVSQEIIPNAGVVVWYRYNDAATKVVARTTTQAVLSILLCNGILHHGGSCSWVCKGNSGATSGKAYEEVWEAK